MKEATGMKSHPLSWAKEPLRASLSSVAGKLVRAGPIIHPFTGLSTLEQALGVNNSYPAPCAVELLGKYHQTGLFFHGKVGKLFWCVGAAVVGPENKWPQALCSVILVF